MILFKSSFEKTSVVPELNIFLLIASSVPQAASVNPYSTKAHLANGVSTLFINGKPAVINGLRKLGNPPS